MAINQVPEVACAGCGMQAAGKCVDLILDQLRLQFQYLVGGPVRRGGQFQAQPGHCLDRSLALADSVGSVLGARASVVQNSVESTASFIGYAANRVFYLQVHRGAPHFVRCNNHVAVHNNDRFRESQAI